MVSDGGGRFIPAYIADVHTLSLLLSWAAHDRATEDNHTQHKQVCQPGTELGTEPLVGTVHKPRRVVQRMGGLGCPKFVPVLGEDGTKIVPLGDIFDQPPGAMS